MKNKLLFTLTLILFSVLNSIAQITCQEQSDIALVVDLMNDDLGQSFTMSECSGVFNSIELYRYDSGVSTTVQVDIYSGQTATGTPLYTQSGVVIPAVQDAFIID